MPRTNPEPIRKKSAVFWRHGKHAKVDPRLVAGDRRRRPAEAMSASLSDLFGTARRKGKKTD